MKPKLYPLKFKPILKEKIWGGHSLHFKSEEVSTQTKIGESWELSGIEGSTSVIENGVLKGKNLTIVLSDYKDRLIGKINYHKFGTQFPLLIKFIDANEKLSVQLHPDDLTAKAKHDCMGKTEMWYIINAKKNAFVVADFNTKMDKDTYLQKISNNTVQDTLNYIQIKNGDVFFITPGLIHAIGDGVLLAEIQQTSDITYRIYDWDRLDSNGKPRKLHQKEALDTIDFTTKKPKIDYPKKHNAINKVIHNQYFKTEYINVKDNYRLDLSHKDSFFILINVGKKNAVITHNDIQYSLQITQTILLPASIDKVTIHSVKGEFLLVHA